MAEVRQVKKVSTIPCLYQFIPILVCYIIEGLLYQEPAKGFVLFIQNNGNIKIELFQLIKSYLDYKKLSESL